MRKIRSLLFSLLLIGLNLNICAQENTDDAYRVAVKELIKTNWNTQSCHDMVVAGAPSIDLYSSALSEAYAYYIQDRETWNHYASSKKYWVLYMYIAFMQLPNEQKTQLWNAYHERRFYDDQTDIFLKIFKKGFTIEEVRALTDNLPTIKKVQPFIHGKNEITESFRRYLIPYMKGDFQGFEEPKCPNTYKQLCEQLYSLIGMQNAFDKSMKSLLEEPLYKRKADDVKTYYAENKKVFFLRICLENLSEEDLKECVEYVSKQPCPYDEIAEVPDKINQEVGKMCWEKFVEWMMVEEPDIFSVMIDWIKDMRWLK